MKTDLQRKIIKYQLINKHTELVSSGKYNVAKNILHFLNHREIRLGLNDEDWETEQILNEAGIHIQYFIDGYNAYARI